MNNEGSAEEKPPTNGLTDEQRRIMAEAVANSIKKQEDEAHTKRLEAENASDPKIIKANAEAKRKAEKQAAELAEKARKAAAADAIAARKLEGELAAKAAKRNKPPLLASIAQKVSREDQAKGATEAAKPLKPKKGFLWFGRKGQDTGPTDLETNLETKLHGEKRAVQINLTTADGVSDVMSIMGADADKSAGLAKEIFVKHLETRPKATVEKKKKGWMPGWLKSGLLAAGLLTAGAGIYKVGESAAGHDSAPSASDTLNSGRTTQEPAPPEVVAPPPPVPAAPPEKTETRLDANERQGTFSLYAQLDGLSRVDIENAPEVLLSTLYLLPASTRGLETRYEPNKDERERARDYSRKIGVKMIVVGKKLTPINKSEIEYDGAGNPQNTLAIDGFDKKLQEDGISFVSRVMGVTEPDSDGKRHALWRTNDKGREGVDVSVPMGDKDFRDSKGRSGTWHLERLDTE